MHIMKNIFVFNVFFILNIKHKWTFSFKYFNVIFNQNKIIFPFLFAQIMLLHQYSIIWHNLVAKITQKCCKV